jgi:hypothetical protein
MPTLPELVLFSTETTQLETLRSRFESVERILVEEGNGIDVSARCKLDAMWMTPMMAYEAGVPFPLPPHVATIFPMPADRLQRGLPRLIVTGVCLIPGRQYSAEYLSRITAKALVEAVINYNEAHSVPIRRIGAVPGTLGLEDLNDVVAFDAFRQSFDNAADPKYPLTREGLHSEALAGSSRT